MHFALEKVARYVVREGQRSSMDIMGMWRVQESSEDVEKGDVVLVDDVVLEGDVAKKIKIPEQNSQNEKKEEVKTPILPAGSTASSASKDAEKVVPEDTTPSEMTLNEWRERQNKEKKARKAGEGCDSKQWKKSVVLKTKAEQEKEESD